MIELVRVSRGGKPTVQLQTQMLPSIEPDTTLDPSGEKSTDITLPVWALVCSATSASVDSSGSACRASARTRFTSRTPPIANPTDTSIRVRTQARARPPHTLMLWSLEHDTILVPSGEKPTDITWPLWAFVRSATSASIDPSAPRNCTRRRRMSRHSPHHTQQQRTRPLESDGALTPQFNAPVVSARYDLCAVGREAHGIHAADVGIRLLRHERQ
eukprot:6378868-Prymnesium_polylepis.2